METMSSRIRAMGPVFHLMVTCFLFNVAFLTPLPFTVDIFLGAICPGQTECPQLMVVLGAQQLVTGLGAILLSPALGGLSDDYGRKPVLMVVFFSSILPSLLLAISISKVAVYMSIVLVMIISVLRDGGFLPTLLAYVADALDENQRPAAVGFLMASMSVGFLGGTMTALVLKTAFQAYWAAVIVQTSATIYLLIFVKETNPRSLMLPANKSQSESTAKLLPNPVSKRRTHKLRETAMTIWRSKRLRTIALVDFTYTLVGTTSGLQNFTLYFLKATFDYGKNQLAVIVIVGGVGVVVGQMLVYPLLAYLCGERGVLWIGLLGFAAHYFIYSLAWSPWVPYLAASMGVLYSLVSPAVGTMASRGVDHEHQGKVQGFMAGARSAGTIVAPLVLTPLAATALGPNPPLNIREWPFIVGGSVMVVAWLISLGLPSLPSTEHVNKPTNYNAAPLAQEDSNGTTEHPEDLHLAPEIVDADIRVRD